MAQVKLGKFKLEFASPKALNELTQGQFTEKVIWSYNDDPNSELVIDADNWHIECLSNGKTGKLIDWLVNEKTHQFAIKGEATSEDYVEIEYPFAVAMLGQLVDRTDLIRYLASLQKTFGQMKSDDKATNEIQNDINNNNFD